MNDKDTGNRENIYSPNEQMKMNADDMVLQKAKHFLIPAQDDFIEIVAWDIRQELKGTYHKTKSSSSIEIQGWGTAQMNDALANVRRLVADTIQLLEVCDEAEVAASFSNKLAGLDSLKNDATQFKKDCTYFKSRSLAWALSPITRSTLWSNRCSLRRKSKIDNGN